MVTYQQTATAANGLNLLADRPIKPCFHPFFALFGNLKQIWGDFFLIFIEHEFMFSLKYMCECVKMAWIWL